MSLLFPFLWSLRASEINAGAVFDRPRATAGRPYKVAVIARSEATWQSPILLRRGNGTKRLLLEEKLSLARNEQVTDVV